MIDDDENEVDDFWQVRVFDEVPEECNEEWTHGAMVGGMAAISDHDIAKQYMMAANELARIGTKNQNLYDFIYPTCFLYRHAVELYLKSIVCPARKNHSLRNLIGQFETFLEHEFHQQLDSCIKDFLLEFDKIDSGSVAFRYYDPSNLIKRDGEMTKNPLWTEKWADISLLKAKMDIVVKGFERILNQRDLSERFGGGTHKEHAK